MPNTPYMSLILPIVSITPGPTWAQELNSAYFTIDSHDHTVGKGVPIPSSALNINQDLNFNGFNAINLRSTRYDPQLSPLSLVTDIGCIYVSGVDMWFNDGNGNQIQLTAGGALNAASIGGIGGDYTTSTASVFYTSADKTFTFWQNTNIPAIIDCGWIVLRNPTLASHSITFKIDPSISSDYIVTFPNAVPGVTSALTLDTSGNIGYTTSFVTSTSSPWLDGHIVVYSGSSGTQIRQTNVVIDGSDNMLVPGLIQFENASGAAIATNSDGKTLFAQNSVGPSALPLIVSTATGSGTGLLTMRGSVDSTGALVAGEGFSCIRPITGEYIVNFTNVFADTPVVTLQINNNIPGSTLMCNNISNTQIIVFPFDGSNASMNSGFSFIAIGIRGA